MLNLKRAEGGIHLIKFLTQIDFWKKIILEKIIIGKNAFEGKKCINILISQLGEGGGSVEGGEGFIKLN